MGLDMYLHATRSITTWDGTDTELVEKLKEMMPEMASFDPDSIMFQVAYWRKANAIHKWFVDNVQDGIDECQESPVCFEKLEELRDLVIGLLERRDPAEASEKLPPTAGFFFGSCDMDEWYWHSLEDTKKQLDNISKMHMLSMLKYGRSRWCFSYRASW